MVNTAVVGQVGTALATHPAGCGAARAERMCSPFHRAELLLISDEAVHIEMQDYELDHVCCGDRNTLPKGSNVSNCYSRSFSEHKP